MNKNIEYLTKIASIHPRHNDVNAPIDMAIEAVENGCDNEIIVKLSKQSRIRDFVSGIHRMQTLIMTAAEELDKLIKIENDKQR